MSIRSAVSAVGAFVYEFVIGETPEFAAGVAVIIVGGWAISHTVGGATAVVCVPVAVIALLLVSVWRGTAAK